jgi:hypothetical protein
MPLPAGSAAREVGSQIGRQALRIRHRQQTALNNFATHIVQKKGQAQQKRGQAPFWPDEQA